MSHKFLKFVWLLLAAQLWLTPGASAQSPIIDNLLIEIWPEYDRPEALVIYRGEVSPDTTFPAEVTFALPGYINSMHVVAVEQNGTLREIRPPDYTLQTEEEQSFLTFQVPSGQFQFEYYDPVVLAQREAERTLTFQFTSPYLIRQATFEVQEPFGATNFTMTPAPTESSVQGDGLRYNFIHVSDLTPDETFDLSATYQRSSTTPSVESFTSGVATNVAVETPSTTADPWFAYILIGIGAVLLMASIGMWWRLRQVAPARAPRSDPATAPVRAASGAKFCYRCGASLRPEGNFCHNCGAERRQ